METAHLVLDIGLALLLAAAFGWVARKLGLPAVVGYLAAGLAVSPFTPGYEADRHQIELMAELGVVFLIVLGGAAIWYFVSAKNWFKGPKVQGTPEELAAIEADLELLA